MPAKRSAATPGRAAQAVAALERFVAALDSAKGPDSVTDGARAHLAYDVATIIDMLS